ncbi:MAG TPA: hypothetical protein VGZ52_09580 [Acidimicrobiales bacterium]|nr:hypothetical protein [Acidimicrobiales bacterium]
MQHTGSTYRWPHFDPNGAGFVQGHVRVGARVESLAPEGRVLTTTFADLPSDLLPGDAADIDVAISARSDDGRGLAAGDYVVVVDLYQVGAGWFADLGSPPATARLHVDPSA